MKKYALDKGRIDRFRKEILDHYRAHGRGLPWRRTRNPYRVLVSEVMLQQTQVERVVDKYKEFLKAFPGVTALAQAPLKEVLSVWQGLGYNRRAKALKEAAEMIVRDFRGKVPRSIDDLVRLPGIGTATASSIAAFAFNAPAVFIETNIRRVFIRFFFHDREGIADSEILPLVEKTLERSDPKTWYNALMDYGVMLKRTEGNANTRSAHYRKQSAFHGSDRQVRGAVLKVLGEKNGSLAVMQKELGVDATRLQKVLDQLLGEGFLVRKGKAYAIV